MRDKKPMPDPTPEVPGGKTPFEKMTELTRRVIQVPKSSVAKPKKALRKRR